jgi:hypothetical protein
MYTSNSLLLRYLKLLYNTVRNLVIFEVLTMVTMKITAIFRLPVGVNSKFQRNVRKFISDYRALHFKSRQTSYLTLFKFI